MIDIDSDTDDTKSKSRELESVKSSPEKATSHKVDRILDPFDMGKFDVPTKQDPFDMGNFSVSTKQDPFDFEKFSIPNKIDPFNMEQFKIPTKQDPFNVELFTANTKTDTNKPNFTRSWIEEQINNSISPTPLLNSVVAEPTKKESNYQSIINEFDPINQSVSSKISHFNQRADQQKNSGNLINLGPIPFDPKEKLYENFPSKIQLVQQPKVHIYLYFYIKSNFKLQ